MQRTAAPGRLGTAIAIGRTTAMTIALGAAMATGSARGAEDKYHITDAEKAACTMDAMRLCSGTYPNEDGLLSCMRDKHSSLSSTCRVAFDAGVRRRRL